MIFGKTAEEKLRIEQNKIYEMINGKKEFCFFPRRLADGRTVWLQYVYTYYVGSFDIETLKYFLWSNSPDTYCPYGDSYLTKNDSYVRRTDKL